MNSHSKLENNAIRSEPTDDQQEVAFGEPISRVAHSQTKIVATYSKKDGLEIRRVMFR